MKLKKLTLHNFGVYAETNEFNFESNKPVVLIGGMNGRGKTTFLEAILLALYGSNSFAYAESKYRSYGQYLKSYVNAADGTLKSFVKLEFVLDSDDEKYIICRSWGGTGKRTHEQISVMQNEEYNEFLTENWAMFIENILPSGLSNFFFFDGEKIAELAEEDTNDQMKESIKILLGINIVDGLENDLNRISNRIIKKDLNLYSSDSSDLLRKKKDDAYNLLLDLDEEMKMLQESCSLTEKKIEKARHEYESKGGEIYEKQQDLVRQRQENAARLDSNEESLVEIAASGLPLLLVKDLLNDIQSQSAIEREERENQMAIKKVQSMYVAYQRQFPEDNIEHFLKFMVDETNKQKIEFIYNLSDVVYLRLVDLCKYKLNNLNKNKEKQINEKKKIIEEIDKIDSYLSVEIDEKAISKSYKKIILLENQKTEAEAKIEILRRKRPSINGDYMTANSDFNRYVESMLSNLEGNEKNDRVLKYSHQMIEVMERYKIKLQSRKIQKLAETMTDCYKKLANKKSLIDHISMDDITLDFAYINANGEEISKARLSAGEKQLMVVSLLWALAICSKRKLPVIIDTPLSRLDSKHRMSFIKIYFPKASDQTIILSTDSEIYGNYYEAMKKNVGDEFTLEYDDKQRRTTIVSGYFMEESI